MLKPKKTRTKELRSVRIDIKLTSILGQIGIRIKTKPWIFFLKAIIEIGWVG
jgi:hypothetical protein